jgi:hypothetical protein
VIPMEEKRSDSVDRMCQWWFGLNLEGLFSGQFSRVWRFLALYNWGHRENEPVTWVLVTKIVNHFTAIHT